MDLYAWAKKWNVPFDAVMELMTTMGIAPTLHMPMGEPGTEAGATQKVRLAAAKGGGLLWRNNVGAMQDESGRVIRYGLANESKQMNKVIKSSDLVGIMPMMISYEMVGQVIGRFVAIEMKAPGWSYAGTEHEQAQLKFIELVIAKGGIGRFSTGE